MRRNRKQITALALALRMTTTGMTGFKALAMEGEVGISTVDASGKGTMGIAIKGTIKATQINVTVPLEVTFGVSPGKSGTAVGKPSGSKVDAGIITNASNYTITNNSATSARAYISKIKARTGSTVGATLGKGISSVGTVPALQSTADNNNVMIAIKKDGQSVTLSMLNVVEGDGRSFWLTTSFSGNYYMGNDEKNETNAKGKLETAGVAGNANIMNLRVYALTMGTWQDDSKFAVTLTFIVLTTTPTI